MRRRTISAGALTGAAILATGGAVRGGAGMVRLVTGTGSAAAVRRDWPEVVVCRLGEIASASAHSAVVHVQHGKAVFGQHLIEEQSAPLPGIAHRLRGSRDEGEDNPQPGGSKTAHPGQCCL